MFDFSSKKPVLVLGDYGSGKVYATEEVLKKQGKRTSYICAFITDPMDINPLPVQVGGEIKEVPSPLDNRASELGENGVLLIGDIEQANPYTQDALVKFINRHPDLPMIVFGVSEDRIPAEIRELCGKVFVVSRGTLKEREV